MECQTSRLIDEVAELQERLEAAERLCDQLVDGIKHANSELLGFDEIDSRSEMERTAKRVLNHLRGTITDDKGEVMITRHEAALGDSQ